MNTFTAIEIIKSVKIVKIEDLLLQYDCIIDILKDDVYRVIQSKNIHFADFDWVYSQSSMMLTKSLQKKHLKAIQKFHACQNIEVATKWLLARVINNMKNITINNSYRMYVALPELIAYDDNLLASSDTDVMLDEMHIPQYILTKGLLKVWKDAECDDDFDFQDFYELCLKFKIDPYQILSFM